MESIPYEARMEPGETEQADNGNTIFRQRYQDSLSS